MDRGHIVCHVTYTCIEWEMPRGSHVSLGKLSSGGVDQSDIAMWHTLPRQYPSPPTTPSRPRSDLGSVP